MEGTPQSGSLAKAKRNPVRRNPEKRRQQNIQAQRKYREKLRERLEALETIAASVAQTKQLSLTTDTTRSGLIQPEAALDYSIVDEAGRSLWTDAPKDVQPPRPPPDIDTPASSIWQSTTYLTPPNDISSSLSTWDSTAWESMAQLPMSEMYPTTVAFSNPTVRYSPSDASSTAPGVPLTHIDPSILMHAKHKVGIDRPGVTTTVECDCSSPHLQVQTSSSSPNSRAEVRILNIGPVARAPDPYAGHLRLETMCTLAAIDALRMHIGITEEMLCVEECPSPFYRSIRGSATDAARENMIGTIQGIFKTLMPDMRPSADQITVEHPPYIDIFPFRTLRHNLILHQEEVDEDEFLRDALAGLVCWGGAGISKKDRDVSTGNASSGTPWDNRSWEAKAWFLNKYWAWLGAEEGELVRQSEWWRSIRGEDQLDLEVLA